MLLPKSTSPYLLTKSEIFSMVAADDFHEKHLYVSNSNEASWIMENLQSVRQNICVLQKNAGVEALLTLLSGARPSLFNKEHSVPEEMLKVNAPFESRI